MSNQLITIPENVKTELKSIVLKEGFHQVDDDIWICSSEVAEHHDSTKKGCDTIVLVLYSDTPMLFEYEVKGNLPNCSLVLNEGSLFRFDARHLHALKMLNGKSINAAFMIWDVLITRTLESYLPEIQDRLNCYSKKLNTDVLTGSHIPPFRLGKKQDRAILDSKGKEVVIFPKGSEYMAKDFVEYLNNKSSCY